jgi:hypothetical protein
VALPVSQDAAVIVKHVHLERLRRMLRVLDAVERVHQTPGGEAHPGSVRAGRIKDAEALRHVLAQIEDHFAQERDRPLPAPGVMPEGQPAFFVMVNAISRFGDIEPRLAWGSPYPDRYALLGPDKKGRKFACFPVHDGGALLPPEPTPIPASAPRAPWPFPVSAHTEKEHS